MATQQSSRLRWMFTYQMRVRLEKERRRLAIAKAASVAEIPDYAVRTPLQRLVQILKRHRDIRYAGNEHRPISIIITTLAGLAYSNEESLSDAIESAVPKMRTLVETRGGSYWIPNPVNPAENFADKWSAEPVKARVFFEWLAAVERDYRTLLTPSGFRDRERHLVEAFGARDAAAALKRVSSRRSSVAIPVVPSSPTTPENRFDVRHRERPPWPMAAAAVWVPIRGTYTRNGSTSDFLSDGRPLPKGCDLMFFADGSAIPNPIEVYWQVVNTGPEAASVPGGLRGQFLHAKSAGRGGLRQKEATAYTGSHWIQCFIVKDGRCIGRSREFVVNIE